MFDRREAQRALRRYRKRGPAKTTRALTEALRGADVSGATVIDIGGGVGAVPHALLEAGARAATDVDVSSSYVAAARAEAERRGSPSRSRSARVTSSLWPPRFRKPTSSPWTA